MQLHVSLTLVYFPLVYPASHRCILPSTSDSPLHANMSIRNFCWHWREAFGTLLLL
uniref:Uncharacterized protein n=1 Tax=Trichobilharzia regenti TaxID=157069 RepID=A0AA85J3V9_TRIRE